MELTLDGALKKALDAHRNGHVQEADQFYKAILKAQPTHSEANHNLGILNVGLGNMENALLLFKKALETRPSEAQFWLSYINALIKLERLFDAKAVLDQAKEKGATGEAFDQIERQISSLNVNPQDPPSSLLQPVINAYSQGQFQQALADGMEVLESFPSSAILYNILGASNAGLMQFGAAIKNYQKALKIRPNQAETYFNMGNALNSKGNLGAAINCYKQAIKINPKSASAYNNMGMALNDKDELEAAISSYTEALKINPNYAEAYNNIGNALNNKGELEAAINNYNHALKIKPDYAQVYNNKGCALKDQGDLDSAINNYKQALNINPDFAEAYRNLGSLKCYKEHDEHLLRMQKLYDDPHISNEQRCHVSFALSKAFEDLNEVNQSFTYLKMGNQLRKKMLFYDIKQDIEQFNQLKKSHLSIAEAALQPAIDTSEPKPIFILGMPRSGTTLVEQIISSHSEVTGAGELNYVEKFGQTLALGMIKPDTEKIFNFRKNYIKALKKRSDARSIVTDKMPQNFSYVGLIFSAFPEAKIINVNRDPAATCWSNYKHYFETKALGYSYNLDDVVTYFGLYRDLMKFWQGYYGDRIYNMNYENLIIDQENETRQLIRYLGLDWEDCCLSPESNKREVRTASTHQVRQRVYQDSSQQWRKFSHCLNGVFEKLNREVE